MILSVQDIPFYTRMAFGIVGIYEISSIAFLHHHLIDPEKVVDRIESTKAKVEEIAVREKIPPFDDDDEPTILSNKFCMLYFLLSDIMKIGIIFTYFVFSTRNMSLGNLVAFSLLGLYSMVLYIWFTCNCNLYHGYFLHDLKMKKIERKLRKLMLALGIQSKKSNLKVREHILGCVIFVCVCTTTNYEESIVFGIIGAFTIFFNLFFKLYYLRIEQMEEDLLKIEFLKGKIELTDESNEKFSSSCEDDNGKDTEEDLLSFNDIA